jgi:hypothetical protein
MAHPTTVARLIDRSVFSGMGESISCEQNMHGKISNKLVGAIRQDKFVIAVVGVARRMTLLARSSS